MGANVFLSYATADRGLGERVAQALTDRGIIASAIPITALPGDDWAGQMRSDLQNTDAVVLVLSETASTNLPLMAELGAAMALNKRIVAITTGEEPLRISLPSSSHVQIVAAAGMTPEAIAATISAGLVI